jgi:hypothetical protein
MLHSRVAVASETASINKLIIKRPVVISPEANYTERTAAAAGEPSADFYSLRMFVWSAQRTPSAVNLSFLDSSQYSFFQATPQLSSRGWMTPFQKIW